LKERGNAVILVFAYQTARLAGFIEQGEWSTTNTCLRYSRSIRTTHYAASQTDTRGLVDRVVGGCAAVVALPILKWKKHP
jgi:hypothetical protein